MCVISFCSYLKERDDRADISKSGGKGKKAKGLVHWVILVFSFPGLVYFGSSMAMRTCTKRIKRSMTLTTREDSIR